MDMSALFTAANVPMTPWEKSVVLYVADVYTRYTDPSIGIIVEDGVKAIQVIAAVKNLVVCNSCIKINYWY